MNEKYNLLTDVWFLHPEEGWKNSYIISRSVQKNGLHHYLVAGHGSPVFFKAILTEEDYLIKKKLNQLDTLKRLIELEMVQRGLIRTAL